MKYSIHWGFTWSFVWRTGAVLVAVLVWGLATETPWLRLLGIAAFVVAVNCADTYRRADRAHPTKLIGE